MMTLFDHIYSYSRLLRTVFCCLLLGALFVPTMVMAQEVVEEVAAEKATDDVPDDPYTVEDIEVDVTADNAVEAQRQAFEEAQIKGYEALANRFLSEEEMAAFESPDINTVSSFVNDFEVTNEKLSAVRYKGTYTIRFSKNTFNKPDIDGLYGNTAMSQTGETLIVPFFETSGRYFLWQVNPFLNAWARARSNKVLGKAIVPIGDVEDLSQVRGEQGLSYDPSRLNSMRLRYQARDVALMIATPEALPDGTTNVLVSIYNAKPYGPELSKQFSVRGYPGEFEDQLYNRVVAQISGTLHADWKRDTAVTVQNDPQENPRPDAVQRAPLTGPKTSITAQINFSTARQWVETKKSIERARTVKSVQVKSLSPRSATLGIDFVGDIQNLRTALLQQGVELNEPGTQYTQTGAGQQPIYQLLPMREQRQFY